MEFANAPVNRRVVTPTGGLDEERRDQMTWKKKKERMDLLIPLEASEIADMNRRPASYFLSINHPDAAP